jgi:hypothetical protein
MNISPLNYNQIEFRKKSNMKLLGLLAMGLALFTAGTETSILTSPDGTHPHRHNGTRKGNGTHKGGFRQHNGTNFNRTQWRAEHPNFNRTNIKHFAKPAPTN